MSKVSKPKSSEGQGPQEEDSVYDFLYHDARRIGSFLAQLDPNGHLQSLKQAARAAGSRRAKVSLGGGGGLPGVVSAQGASEDEEGEQWDRSSEKSYDPLWANARAFLDLVDQRKLLRRDIHNSRIGQFVLSSGLLQVVDLRLLKSVWENPEVVSQLLNAKGIVSGAEQSSTERLGLEFIKLFPHIIQGYVYTVKTDSQEASASWINLDPDCMVISAQDLLMKHGLNVAGIWSIIGILDAFPGDNPVVDSELVKLLNQGMESAVAARHKTVMALLAELLAPLARMIMGRPGGYYGMTPLLIFREVS